MGIKGPSVDVRDVAKLHIAAFEDLKLDGKRLIASNDFWDAQKVLDVARKYYPEISHDLPKGTPGSSEEAAKTSIEVNNAETRKLTGLEWIPIETTLRDTIGQIAEVLKSG